MAKYIEYGHENASDPRYSCRFCNGQHDVQIEQQNSGYGEVRTITIQRQCMCASYGTLSATIGTSVKETKVAKQFDTTEAKNLALNSIVSKVKAVEVALYNRTHAIAKAEAEHAKLIADASNALNNVLAEAFQNGIEEEDFENHLPDYQDDLSERLNIVASDMSLANVLEGV